MNCEARLVNKTLVIVGNEVKAKVIFEEQVRSSFKELSNDERRVERTTQYDWVQRKPVYVNPLHHFPRREVMQFALDNGISNQEVEQYAAEKAAALKEEQRFQSLEWLGRDRNNHHWVIAPDGEIMAHTEVRRTFKRGYSEYGYTLPEGSLVLLKQDYCSGNNYILEVFKRPSELTPAQEATVQALEDEIQQRAENNPHMDFIGEGWGLLARPALHRPVEEQEEQEEQEEEVVEEAPQLSFGELIAANPFAALLRK